MNKNIEHKDLKKVFSPTPVKANYKYGSLFRTKKWTTNGHWLIQTSKETPALQKVRSGTREIKLTKFIKGVKMASALPAKIMNEIILHEGILFIKVKGGEGYEWYNSFYLSLLCSILPESTLYLKPHEDTHLLTFYENENMLGIIYPLRKEVLENE